jgi:Schlafen group 3, DNA/RNA helicase domain
VSGDDYPQADHGWSSSFPEFREAAAPYVRQSLIDFLKNVSPEQLRAWDESIPPLQAEVGQVLGREPSATTYSAILEYQLPMEQRRPDVIFLLGGVILVLELKGKAIAELADIDQASAYARDLRAYHRDCEDRNVRAALVLMRARGRQAPTAGVEVLGPDAIDALAAEIDRNQPRSSLTREQFLDPAAYRPTPTIVEAARELMERGSLRRIHRAAAATEPTLEYLANVAREAARTKTRRLVLISGLPGTGKTLVGLQLAHARFLDDLAVARGTEKPTAPAVYLSGNGPLVEVLQYELKAAGGGGKTFVRAIKKYVDQYSRRAALVPPEHVLIFDEAQRAHDADQVAQVHGSNDGLSEPEHFIEFAERVPEWCVVVGLLGSGQEIHVGEEAGVGQWRTAVLGSTQRSSWTVHAPPGVEQEMVGVPALEIDPRLHLETELRFHLAQTVHPYVERLLADARPDVLQATASSLEGDGYTLRVTRDLEEAKHYLRDRYDSDPQARFGLVASSRDRDLVRFGIPNDWSSTQRLKYGPWFVEGDDDSLGRSCRALRDCVTEFGCQGLELDGALIAWGTDFILEEGQWTNRYARPYQQASRIRDPLQLRRNAYRVLLTRARDGSTVFVPPIPILDETYGYLVQSGFRVLG